MTTPSWRDSGLGTMKRAALWLVEEIGVGNVFTKSQLREAFPETSQIDRRMRDLRDFGWRIDTNREDPGLDSSEQRFVVRGDAVWEPGRATRKAGSIVTAAERYTLMARDGHKCRSCGIGPGEKYSGSHMTSQLDVARRSVRLPGGQETVQLVIECNRCRVGGREQVADVAELRSRIERLSSYERQILAGWIADDRRSFSETEDLWALYRTLPADARDEIHAVVRP